MHHRQWRLQASNSKRSVPSQTRGPLDHLHVPDFISAVMSLAVRFHNYEYALIEIFLTCGT